MRFKIVVLEERIVLDATLAPFLDHHVFEKSPLGVTQEHGNTNIQDRSFPFQDTNPIEANSGVQVVVISSAISDAQQLASLVKPGVITIVYNPDTSLTSLASEISEALNGQRASSIAFATEGSYGQFALTNGENVSLQSLTFQPQMQAFWTQVGSLLTRNGSIDILSCDVAGDTSGLDLVHDLQQMIDTTDGKNISVNASTDLTGNPAEGGNNWILDVGNVNAGALFFNTSELNTWDHVLGETISGTLTSITYKEGVSTASGTTVAIFNTSSAPPIPSYTATITWGDGGPTTQGTVTFEGGSTWIVTAGHEYNNFDITNSNLLSLGYKVVVTDTNGGATDTINSGGVDTLEGIGNVTIHSLSTINEVIPADTVLASFTDSSYSNGNIPSNVTATINWIDGNSNDSTSQITLVATGTYAGGTNNGSNEIYDIENTNSFTYSSPGTYSGSSGSTAGMTVTINDNNTATYTTAPATNYVHDVTSVTGQNQTFTQDTSSSQVVGTFTDSDPNASASNFSVSESGLPTGLTYSVSHVSGTEYEITATGAPSEYGTFSGNLILKTDESGATILDQVDGPVTLTVNPILASGIASSTLTGIIPTGTEVASFTDAKYNGITSDFTASVSWGDGGTSSTSQTSIVYSNGTFYVDASHTYSAYGNGPMTVTINDVPDGTSVTTTAVTNIVHDVTSITGTTSYLTENINSSQLILRDFC